MHKKLSWRRLSLTIVGVEEMSIKHSDCVSVALFTQHVSLIFTCRIILQSAACCAARPFGTLPYKRHEFRKRSIE